MFKKLLITPTTKIFNNRSSLLSLNHLNKNDFAKFKRDRPHLNVGTIGHIVSSKNIYKIRINLYLDLF